MSMTEAGPHAGPASDLPELKDGVQLWLVRHGETEWSAAGKHTGTSDLPLTDAGEQQARALAPMLADLAPTLVLSSPRKRALDTARLAELAVDEVTEDLAEWDYGEYEGFTTAQVRERVPGWTVWTHPCPGGESADQIGARAVKIIERVRAVLPHGDVILVGHGHFSRVLVAGWIGLPVPSGVHFRLDAAGIAVLGEERGVPQVHRLNVPPVHI
jgi:broad specificity phosphatase PhoE